MVGGEGIASIKHVSSTWLTNFNILPENLNCVTEYSDRETCKRTDLL